MRRVLRAVVLTLLMAGGVGPAPAQALTVTDQTGRALELPGPPRRIVSLVPSVTEILYALGQDEHLVGVTDFCDYPAAARAKPSVGTMVGPSLEAIVALRPDLVVLTTAGNRDETFLQLQRLRLPIYVVNPTSLAQALDLMEQLARLTGRPEAAGAVVGALRRRVREVAARVAPRPRPRVLYVVWPEPLVVPGRNAIVSELIELAGGRSITATSGEGYPRYSVEAALARNPEVILIASHDAARSPLMRAKWERFTQVPAVSAGRLYTLDGNLMHRYGPRMVDGLEVLARLLHPEALR